MMTKMIVKMEKMEKTVRMMMKMIVKTEKMEKTVRMMTKMDIKTEKMITKKMKMDRTHIIQIIKQKKVTQEKKENFKEKMMI